MLRWLAQSKKVPERILPTRITTWFHRHHFDFSTQMSTEKKPIVRCTLEPSYSFSFLRYSVAWRRALAREGAGFGSDGFMMSRS